MSILLALFVATFTPLVSFLESTTALTSQVSTRTALSGDSPTTCDSLFCEVKEAQFKLAQLGHFFKLYSSPDGIPKNLNLVILDFMYLLNEPILGCVNKILIL